MKERAAKRATLRDIAQDVGVSIGTVSVILNGSRSGTSVADRTRDAIHESAKRLGYRPNWVAKSLRGGKTRTIGIIPTRAGENFLLGPYIQRVLNAAVNVLAAEHYDVLLLTRCDQSDEKGILEGVVNGRIDGAIVVAPRAESRLVETLTEARFPFVVIDGANAGHEGFTVDDVEGTRLGLEHLRSLGHERIGYVAGPDWLASGRARLAAFREAWNNPLSPPGEGGAADPLIAHGDFGILSGYEAVRDLLSRSPRPTALLCANDEMAMGAYRAARELDLRVPKDLSVVGFDNSPNSADAHPPLTTYEQPVERMAAAAAQAILSAIHDFHPVQGACFPGHFVVRQSTSRPKMDL